MPSRHFYTALLLGGALPAIASAQTAPGEPPAADVAAEADAGEATSGIGDIIVTAQRRSESVQKSSLAIQVLGAEDLAKNSVTEAADLQNVIPGLSIGNAGARVQTYIRGVGAFGTDQNAESAVTYNINGVYIARTTGIGPIFYDLDRVEVLKGPQGTLYGRNATGGAINLITKKPQLGKTGGGIDLEVGDYDLKRLGGYINLSPGDKFAIRAAFKVVDRDGYLSDGYNDEHAQAGRLLALWEPSAAVSLLVMGELTHIGGQGEAVVKRSTLTPVPSDPWEGPSVGALQQPPTALLGGTVIDDDGFLDTDVKAISAELNVDLGFATLTALPAYRDTDFATLSYTPGFRFDAQETSKQTSVELRLSNETDALKWVGGFYYFDEDQSQAIILRAVPIQQNNNFATLTTESWAVFGEATYSLLPSLRLIGGLRYTHEEKEQAGVQIPLLADLTPRPGAQLDLGGEESWNRLTWKVGAEYDVGESNMLFATVATGSKAGGFFAGPRGFNSFEPEHLTAFTVGSRNRFFDNSFQLNLEAFYWKYDDKQERFLGARPTGEVGLYTTNAGAATLYGLDIDAEWRVTPNDRLRATAEYLHTNYDEFGFIAYNPAPGGFPPTGTVCALGAAIPFTPTPSPVDTTQPVDCSGFPLVKAPKWSGSFSYDHTFDLSNGGTIVVGGTGTFASSQWLSADFVASGRDNGYVLLNANLTYNAPEPWSLSIWGRNLANEAVYSGGARYSFTTTDPTLYYANIRPPRTYGVTLKLDF